MTTIKISQTRFLLGVLVSLFPYFSASAMGELGYSGSESPSFRSPSENFEAGDMDSLLVELDERGSAAVLANQPSTPEGVSINFDPQTVADAPAVEVSLEQLEKLSQEMRRPEYQTQLAEKVIIPVSTADPENLKLLSILSPQQMAVFMGKKTRFLENVGKFLSYFRLKPTKINKVISISNEEFFKKAAVVADANTKVMSFQLGVGTGIGLMDVIMKKLKERPAFKHLPDRAGFYYMFAAGFSIVKTTTDGKTRMSFEPIVEFRRATRIFAPFAFIAGGFSGSFTWENRAAGVTTLQRSHFYRLSSLNFIAGLQQFGFAGALAAVFPIGGGAAAGMEGEVYRFRITREMFPAFMNLVKDFIGRARFGGKICSAALRHAAH